MPAVHAQQQRNAPQDEPNALPQALSGEAPTLRFERLGLEDGLAQQSVMSMMQDSAGFVWIGTQGGLHRYDGREMKVYAPQPFDTTSLSSGFVRAVDEAENGDLWVATDGGGLNRLDPATGRTVHYRHRPGDSTSIASDGVADVLETKRGDVWAVTGDAGLSRLDPATGRFTQYRHDPGDPASLSSNYLTLASEGEDAEGHVWFGSGNGVNRLDPQTGEVERFLHVAGAPPGGANIVFEPYLPPETPGTAWLPTSNGLVRLDYETGETERFLVAPNPAGSNSSGGLNPRNRLREIAPDPQEPGVLWITGSGAGLVRFDTQAERFTAYRHDPQDPNSLGSNDGSALLADRSGTMWVGTYDAGLSTFNPRSLDFVHLRHDPGDSQSLAPGAAYALYEDTGGALWAATQVSATEYHLTRFGEAARGVRRYRSVPGDTTSLLPNNISAMAEDPAGHLWVGHAGAGEAGLSRLDPRTGRVRRYHHPRTPQNARRNSVRALLPTAADPGVLWAAGHGGLQRFDTRTGRFTPVPLDARLSNPTVIITLHQDAEGTLWAAGYGQGLLRLAPGADTLRLAAAHDPTDTTSIGSDVIVDMHEREAEPGVLWLGTAGGGLSRYDTETGEARTYLKEDGLPDNTIYGILEDEAGTLWMSTNNGISNFDPATETFENYGLEDGLLALEYNNPGSARGQDGVLYFGSSEGITAFRPGAMQTNPTPPQVALTGLSLFNKPVAVGGPDSLLKKSLSKTKELRLAHDQNQLTFEFAALHYENPAGNEYAYRLDGYDEDWVQAGTRREASYTNLPPGDYRFEVKAANADGVWNETPATVALSIAPPWWRTWGAYLGYALLLCAAVFAVDRVQRRRLTKKEAERARIREAQLQAQAEERRREDADRLSEMGRAITSTLSVEEVVGTVYEHVNAFMDAAVFGIGVYEADRNRLLFPATKEKGETLPPYAHALDDANRPAAWCFNHRAPLIVGDFASEYREYLPQRAAPVAGESVASIIYLPLVHQRHPVGVITTQSFEKDAYTDYHVSVLETLANYAAVAIDNASAYRRLDATVRDLKETQQQLVQQEKLASLGELTAGIAHEIKNPLNFVTNFSGLSEELIGELQEAQRAGDTEEVEAILSDLQMNVAMIEKHGRRADGIVRSMMAHARTGTGERTATDLNALVEEYVDLAYHGKRASAPDFNAEIVRDLGEDVGQVEVVPQELGRVVLNLVGNAFDAVMERAASVNGQYAPRVAVSTRRAGREVEIRVEDNGPGMPEAVREKIFEPFFTTKDTGKGTGLGLSMSYDIVAQGHGGELTVESEDGEGTAFVVRLPATPSSVPQPTKSASG